MLYDLIIIGAGPGGMSAAIYAARRKINFFVISMDIGGQMAWSTEVENYPGIKKLQGLELVNSFKEHMDSYGVNVKQEEVVSVEKKAKICIVKTKNNVYETKTVIIASGKSPKKLNVPGEEKFFGKGVHYCATCDAPFYKDKVVAVIGGGNSGFQAVLILAKYAKKIYLLEALPNLGGEPYLRDKATKEKSVQVNTGIKIKEIFGDKFVKGLVCEKDGKDYKINLDGVFIEIGLVSKADFANVQKNRWGEIMLFRTTKANEENMTSVPGIFAAGDVTDIPGKQIIIAAGEGAQAALAAVDYIDKWDKKNKGKY